MPPRTRSLYCSRGGYKRCQAPFEEEGKNKKNVFFSFPLYEGETDLC